MWNEQVSNSGSGSGGGGGNSSCANVNNGNDNLKRKKQSERKKNHVPNWLFSVKINWNEAMEVCKMFIADKWRYSSMYSFIYLFFFPFCYVFFFFKKSSVYFFSQLENCSSTSIQINFIQKKTKTKSVHIQNILFAHRNQKNQNQIIIKYNNNSKKNTNNNETKKKMIRKQISTQSVWENLL